MIRLQTDDNMSAVRGHQQGGEGEGFCWEVLITCMKEKNCDSPVVIFLSKHHDRDN